MNRTHIAKIASQLKLREIQVLATARLLEEDATIPFIARYRKEATGSLDEIVITAIRDRLHQLQELDKRRASILTSLEERDLLTDELREKITAAENMPVLEDIYLPFRPKRRTRASIAREKGLEPLAQLIFAQGTIDPLSEANKFIDARKGVETVDHALQGARDIIAEWVSEEQAARGAVRKLFEEKGTLRARVAPGKQEAAVKYRDYYEWEEGIAKIPSHRLLATMRGESEALLTLHILPEEKDALAILEKQFVKNSGPAAEQVRMAVHDGYKRLLASSMENELRASSKQKADEEAIKVFAENLRQLLLAPPLGQKRIMGIDPGFRTGCKVVCLDRQGKLLQNDTIYPHAPHNQKDKAAEIISTLCEKCSVEVIAIGDGTAGRETYDFVRSLNPTGDGTAVMVDEDGASVYSASPSAQEEFPDHDLTVRGAVSIGRRLMDPLAELVKIEPKSIGVGQYQHDVDQKLLKKKLDEVVMSCVNMVGVELNTASKQLLSYVSGLSPKRAQNIIDYRNDQGPFTSRDELTAVPGLGPKAFEQAAGFLRIRDGNNPLDASAVHPESYHIVEKMAHDLASTVTDLMRDDRLRKKIDLNQYVTETAGLPTLNDIMQELSRPGRDPRDTFVAFSYAEGIHSMEDLQVGMKLPGIVTNITNFGAFIDIGVHQDGLVHISELADTFVKNPAAVVKLHQKVDVTVINVDSARKRISLSMKSKPGAHTGTGSDRRKL